MSFEHQVSAFRRPKTDSFYNKFILVLLAIGAGYLVAENSHADAVSWFGRAHLSFDVLDNGADSAANVSSNASRLGVRGSTDVAEGIQVFYQIESTVDYDNGAASFANRDTFVGVQGDFGRIRLGQIDTPLKSIRGAVEFFGDQIGDVRNLTRLGGNIGAPYGQDFDARFRNGVYYTSPTLGGGFTFNLHYSADTDAAADLSGERTAYSSSIVYSQGGLYLAAAYEQWAARNDSNAIRLGASYKIGDWTISGLLQQANIESLDPTEEVVTVGAGASYKVSDKVLIKGQAYILDAKDREDSGATLVAVGADYIINRQFRLLLAYAATDNDEQAAYRVTGGGGYGDSIATAQGETASGVSFGLRYDF